MRIVLLFHPCGHNDSDIIYIFITSLSLAMSCFVLVSIQYFISSHELCLLCLCFEKRISIISLKWIPVETNLERTMLMTQLWAEWQIHAINEMKWDEKERRDCSHLLFSSLVPFISFILCLYLISTSLVFSFDLWSNEWMRPVKDNTIGCATLSHLTLCISNYYLLAFTRFN